MRRVLSSSQDLSYESDSLKLKIWIGSGITKNIAILIRNLLGNDQKLLAI